MTILPIGVNNNDDTRNIINNNFEVLDDATNKLTSDVSKHKSNLTLLNNNVAGIKKTIDNRGKEIIASEVVQNWLTHNEFKPKDAVATYADLPVPTEDKEIRGVLDTNQMYWYNNGKWTLQSRVDLNGLSNRSLVQASNITFNIPSQYPTVQAAIDDLSTRTFKQGTTITLMIEAGHIVTTPLRLVNGDYSHFIVKSADPVVKVSLLSNQDFITGESAIMPLIAVMFDMQDTGGNGAFIVENSTITFADACGIDNAGQSCLYIRRSNLRASRGNFRGGNYRNVWCTRGSIISIPEGDLSNCKGGDYAVYISRSSNADLSSTKIDDSKATTCALHVLRSRCTFIYGSAKNSAADGIVVTQASQAGCSQADVTGCRGRGLTATSGSSVDFNEGIASNCGDVGIYAAGASNIQANSATVTGCYRNVVAAYGAMINSSGIKTGSALDKNLSVYSGGVMFTDGVTVNGAAIDVTHINLTQFNVFANGGVIYNSKYAVKTAYGTVTDTTIASGEKNIAHRLGVTPDYVNVQVYGSNKMLTAIVTSMTSSSFTIKLYNADGTSAANTTFILHYEVKKTG